MYKVPELSTFEWQKSVQSILSTPPLSPSKGDRYLIGSSATDAWIDKESQIAEYDETWEYLFPFDGMVLNILDINRTLKYSNGWIYSEREIVDLISTNVTLIASQFCNTIVADGDIDQTFILPPATLENIGYWFRFVNIGSYIVTITVASGDSIAETNNTSISNIGDGKYATVKIMIVADGIWAIVGTNRTDQWVP